MDAPPALDGGLDLPYVVYGTLRRGGSNAALIPRHGARWGATLLLPGYLMLDTPHGYPYLTPLDPARASSAPVVAELVEPPADPEAQARLRRDLDALETYRGPGGDNEYDRVAVRVTTDDGEQWAWLYVAARATAVDGLPAIAHGDWMARETA
ncbi:gamma-glutamylcyclotransferase [uncultured Demequina sp.]|uniref:gamma-glutamylcyclotransferase family protein n=1 Tax=uncultured Demequina sp. TaxID=693499 RepID=UPI0025F89ADB|nr:gamma-glutamylcyclotransferase [uncultured Demequina sp.]